MLQRVIEGLVESLQRQINYHQECIDKCKQMLLLMNADVQKILRSKLYHHIGMMMSQRKQKLRLMILEIRGHHER